MDEKNDYDYTPYRPDGEYWFSHAYYPQCRECKTHWGVELYSIDEVHEWCENHSKENGCKEIRVEHVIHWERDE